MAETEAKKEENPLNDNGIETVEPKLKYPRSIPFIISNEFCERFNFYGMKAILVLFLTRKLIYDPDAATMIYHIFNMLVYFTCIFGAIIADSWWGKFNTIVWLSLVYVAGSITMAFSAIDPWLNLDTARALTMLGLALIAIGSGGIKPCVAAFGGEQFQMPAQAKQLATFFSLFYFSINAGSLISTTVTPILREDITCFGMDDCFPLAFGVPAALMVIAVLCFIAGKFLYRILPNQGNMLVKVTRCISNAISTRSREKATNQREHWLEYAEAKFGRKLVLETKILLNVLVLYLPLPFFWALFDQQGSRWTFQATRMDGDIGFYTLKPDQMQVINPLLILVFIPLYEVAFYPLLNLIGVRRPLQKLTLGGVLAGVSFIISAIVEINLEKTYAVLPQYGSAQMRLFNGRNCDYVITTDIPDLDDIELKALAAYQNLYVPVRDGEQNYTLTFSSPNCPNDARTETITLPEKTAASFFINGITEMRIDSFEDNPEKSRRGWPFVTVLSNIQSTTAKVRLVENGNERYSELGLFWEQVDITDGWYSVYIDDQEIAKDIELRLGGVYTFIVTQISENSYQAEAFTITDPNSLSMLWLIPQYVVMTLGEVMFSVTGLEFSFTQAPVSMKSVIQGCWLLTVAFGNLIVVIITGAKFFESQTYEFFLFAGLMFVDMIVFTWLAIRYKEIPLDLLNDVEANENKEQKPSPLEFKESEKKQNE